MSNELGPIFERLGELNGILKGVDDNVKEMKAEHSTIRDKLAEVENHVRSLNSVESKLSHLGINYAEAEDFRDLISWMKRKKASENTRDQLIKKSFITTFVTAVVILVAGYLWAGLKADINVNNTALQQSPHYGNVRGDIPQRKTLVSNSGTAKP